MGHTPYGYKIVNGRAVIDEVEGAAVKKLYEGYLGGLGLQAAADEAGISINHCQAKRMMKRTEDVKFKEYNIDKVLEYKRTSLESYKDIV